MFDVSKKEGLKELELALEQLVNGPFYAALVNDLKEELKKAIPGSIDDLAIDLVVPALAPALKAAILLQVEKISEEV